MLIFALLVFLWVTPVSLRRVRSGGRYRVAGRWRTVPKLVLARPAFYTKSRVLDELAALLRYAGESLDEAGIPWWVTQGTLVGSLRHEGFIPWDHDADLNLRLSDVPALLALRARFERDGFRLRPAAGGFKLGYARWPLFPYLDLVVMERREGVWQLAYPLDGQGRPTFGKHVQWPQEAMPDEDLFPLQRAPFEGFQVWLPRSPEKLAQTMYPGCLDRAVGARFPWLFNHYFAAWLLALGLSSG